jgi:Zn-finger nucleic acid-binding protein
MRQYERSGVTVDQCSECRGIFLDRGELEKLIDAENSWHAAAPPSPVPAAQPRQQTAPPGRPYRDYDSDEYPVYDPHRQQQRRPHKRRSFLSDLFD